MLEFLSRELQHSAISTHNELLLAFSKKKMSLKIIVALKSVAELFHVSIFLLDDRGEKFFVCSFSSSRAPPVRYGTTVKTHPSCQIWKDGAINSNLRG